MGFFVNPCPIEEINENLNLIKAITSIAIKFKICFYAVKIMKMNCIGSIYIYI